MKRLKKNDNVKVITGKDSGRDGKVLAIDYEKSKVIVEGINIVKRHTKASQKSTGGILEKNARLDLSNVALICPKCDEKTKAAIAELNDGKKVRKCRKCGEVIDI